MYSGGMRVYDKNKLWMHLKCANIKKITEEKIVSVYVVSLGNVIDPEPNFKKILEFYGILIKFLIRILGIQINCCNKID